MLSLEALRAICPATSVGRLALFVEPLNEAMGEFQINTPAREAAFLAQVAHESGGFRYVRELAAGHEYDVGRKAEQLGNTPEDDDDGERYKGRGLIQITGTRNYRECSTALFGDPDRLLYQPELLEEPLYAARSAGWYWQYANLNVLADRDDAAAFELITRRINGGINGLKDRVEHWERARRALA